jgi:hypothetical protein
MLSPWLQAGAYVRLADALLARPRAWAVTASAWSAWCARPRAAGPALTLPYLRPVLRGRASKSPLAHASRAGAAAGARLSAAPLALCLHQMSPKAAPSHPHTAPGDIRPRTRWSAAASRSPWHGAAHLTSVWDAALESNPGADSGAPLAPGPASTTSRRRWSAAPRRWRTRRSRPRLPALSRRVACAHASAAPRIFGTCSRKQCSPAAAGVVEVRGVPSRLCLALSGRQRWRSESRATRLGAGGGATPCFASRGLSLLVRARARARRAATARRQLLHGVAAGTCPHAGRRLRLLHELPAWSVRGRLVPRGGAGASPRPPARRSCWRASWRRAYAASGRLGGRCSGVQRAACGAALRSQTRRALAPRRGAGATAWCWPRQAASTLCRSSLMTTWMPRALPKFQQCPASSALHSAAGGGGSLRGGLCTWTA